MSIIPKYLTKEILKQLGIVLIAVVSIYLIVDFFEKSGLFMNAGLPLSRVLTFFALNIPFILYQIAPVGLLLSITIVFSLMDKYNELLALKSSGISFYVLLRPILIMGVIVSVALFLFSDRIVPETTFRANAIWLGEVKKKRLVSSREKNIWIKGERRITHITYYNPIKQHIFGISVSVFDHQFRLIRKIDAQRGVFKDGIWHLHTLIEQTRNDASGAFEIVYREKHKERLDFAPADLSKVVRKPEEMSYGELREYIHKVENEGYDATVHKVNLHAKPAFAFVCIIMCLLGTGLAVRMGTGKGIFFNITYGILLAFFYWICHSFCLSLGYGEMLPPVIAAWITNFLFIVLGLLILAYAE
jgi:lipopolysaccharide export system permease protein